MSAAANPTTSGGTGRSFSTGTSSQNGTGVLTTFNIPHGLGVIPSYYAVTPTSAIAAALSAMSADANNIIVNFLIAPTVGTNNLTWGWMAAI